MKNVLTKETVSDHGDLTREELRERALKGLEDGAVIPAYEANRERVIKILNDALATELVCVLRYKRHAETAKGIHAEAAVAEFLEHAREEQEHADQLAARIGQLNGEPDYNPVHLAERSHTQYVECSNLNDMIKENLIAERIAIEAYGRAIREIGESDPTTRRVLETILEKEEEHADDLAKIYSAYGIKD